MMTADPDSPGADAPSPSSPSPSDASRRAALSRLALLAGGTVGVATMIGPAGVALSPLVEPDRSAEVAEWLAVDVVARFVVGAPPARVVLRQTTRDQWLVRRGETLGAVLVERLGESDFRVLSSVCPHLGCSVVWQPESERWRCPCHKSAFARDGDLIPATSGTPNPAPRGLDPLEWRVSDGRLEVRWVRFETGIAERVEIGKRS